MRVFIFAGRNFKEIVRDPLTIIFGAGFPVVLMGLLTLIQRNIPVELFVIERLVPGISVFGLFFLTLFSGLLIAKDKSSSFLMRLYSSPMKPSDFVLGYSLPMLIIYLIQSVVCYGFGMLLGLTFSVNIFPAILINLPTAIFFISMGIFLGTLLNDKQVGSIAGALLTNVGAWLSGIWFDLSLMGDGFKAVAYALPFANSADCAKLAYGGNYSQLWTPLSIVLIYAAAMTFIAVFAFGRRMKKG